MKKHVCLGGLLVALLLSTGCAFRSPTEWQVAIGTVLFSAFQQGATQIALDELHELHQQEVINNDQYEQLKKLILKCHGDTLDNPNLKREEREKVR